MTAPDLKRIVEAILFAADAPVPLDRIVEILGGPKRSDVRDVLTALAGEYDESDRPFAVTEVAGGWQLYCRPEYLKWVRELHRGRMPTRLSQAALETLAIIAYKQPIVRAEVEIIRGVDSSGVLATLLRRNLIAIAGRAPGMGRALMYRTTREFLRYFGLNTITDLPRLEEFAEVLGLRPDELELAVEGAESLAGVSSGEPDVREDDDAGEGAEESDESEPPGDHGLWPEEAPDSEMPRPPGDHGQWPEEAPDSEMPRPPGDHGEWPEEAADSRLPGSPDDRGEREDEAGEEASPDGARETERAAIFVPGGTADGTPASPPILPGPDSGVHPTPDRKIIDSNDET